MLLKYCGVIHRMNKALWGKLGQFKWALVAAIVVLLIAIFATWRPVKYPATQAYVVGSGKRTTINSNYVQFPIYLFLLLRQILALFFRLPLGGISAQTRQLSLSHNIDGHVN